jgi:hypothetical protein
MLSGLAGVLTILEPDILKRMFELFINKRIAIDDLTDFGQSSLITRVLIWITALKWPKNSEINSLPK